MKQPIMVQDSGKDKVLVYVWEAPVRLTHWLIALSVLVLAGTGIYMGNPFLIAPGEASDNFYMGTAKLIHFYGAIVFSLAVVTRLLWMLLGNAYARWNQFVPTSTRRVRGAADMLSYYLFLRRNPPPTVGHNALAGVAYVGVFLLYLMMIITGLAIYSVSAHVDYPMGAFGFLVPLVGGLQSARWLHHFGMWLILLFVVNHVFSTIEVSALERNGVIGSIFSGWKTVEKEQLDLGE